MDKKKTLEKIIKKSTFDSEISFFHIYSYMNMRTEIQRHRLRFTSEITCVVIGKVDNVVVSVGANQKNVFDSVI